MAEFVGVKWYCSAHGNVGIVKVQNDYHGYDDDNEVKYYIGQCSGENEQMDIQHIMSWGSTFSKEAGDVLFG